MSTASRPTLPVDPSFLRDQAHRCTRLARTCPHSPTALELEALGIELMVKAREVDDALADWTGAE
jgi:hypothetical protein